MFRCILKPLEASPHYQYWTSLIASPFNHYQEHFHELKHLIELRLSGCENHNELPQTIENISLLSILELFHCKSIQSLPTTLGDLKHLTKLKLGGCENLQELPQTIGNISSLSKGDLLYCNSIESLATTFCELKHLTKLKLRRCNNLEELP
jgi:hypothetical protein